MSGFGKIFGGLLADKIEPTNYNQELIKEAKKWLFVREKGGNNRGKEVEAFQKAVDGKAQGESWCAAFVQFCIKQVEERYMIHSQVFKSEMCLAIYSNSPEALRLSKAEPSCLVIWRHGESSDGHIGVCTRVLNEEWFETVEGNTSSDDAVVRDGQGVYLKKRSIHGDADMKVWGYLRSF